MKKLAMPEKKMDLSNTKDMIVYIVEQKQRELEDLNHKVLQKKNTLATVEQSIRTQKADFDQKQREEKVKFEQERDTRLNKLAADEDELKKLQANYHRRDSSLKEHEIANLKVTEERKDLFATRLKAEDLISQNKTTLKNTQTLQAQAQSKLNEAGGIKAQADKLFKEAKQAESRTKRDLELAIEKEKEILRQAENLVKIRAEVKPQIKNLEDINKKNGQILADIEKKELGIEAKIKEDKRLLNEIAEQKKVLLKKSIELASREETITRKEKAGARK